MGDLLTVKREGIEVSLNLLRGGLISRIKHPDLGQIVYDERDGQGIGTSGFAVHSQVIPCEGGDHFDNGNSAVTSIRTAKGAVARCFRTKNWNSGNWSDVDGTRVGMDIQMTIAHAFQILTNNRVAFAQRVTNNSDTQILSTKNLHDGYLFPIAPQLHLKQVADFRFKVGGQWEDAWPEPGKAKGWLDRFDDHFHRSIEAVAAYYPSGKGISIICDGDSLGWYIKHIGEKVTFIGNIWDYAGLQPGQTKTRVTHLRMGKKADIEV